MEIRGLPRRPTVDEMSMKLSTLMVLMGLMGQISAKGGTIGTYGRDERRLNSLVMNRSIDVR